MLLRGILGLSTIAHMPPMPTFSWKLSLLLLSPKDAKFAQLLLERPIRLTFDYWAGLWDQTRFTVLAGKADEQLGFRLANMPPAPYLAVEKVDDCSWAARMGVQSGDKLLAVYRRRTGEISAEQLVNMFKGFRPLRLTFSRLERFTVTVLQQERSMGVQTNSVPPAAFLEIRKVEPGSWGESAGIFVGDALVALNGQCLDNMARREFIRLMKEERPLSLTIDRNHGANSVVQFDRYTLTASLELGNFQV